MRWAGWPPPDEEGEKTRQQNKYNNQIDHRRGGGRPPPDTPCAYDRVGGVYFALPPSRALTKKIDNFSHRRAHADTKP
jgi:hypothetical protein